MTIMLVHITSLKMVILQIHSILETLLSRNNEIHTISHQRGKVGNDRKHN